MRPRVWRWPDDPRWLPPTCSCGLAPPTSANASGNSRGRCPGDEQQGRFHWAARLKLLALSGSARRQRPTWWRHEDGSQWNKVLKKLAWVWILWLSLNRGEADIVVKCRGNLCCTWGEWEAREEKPLVSRRFFWWPISLEAESSCGRLRRRDGLVDKRGRVKGGCGGGEGSWGPWRESERKKELENPLEHSSAWSEALDCSSGKAEISFLKFWGSRKF